jgi:hypothetical protein
MPEVVTKYPEVVLQIIKDAGGKCGVGATQKILKKCPAANFCDMPTGEMCVYSLKDIHAMTQISPTEMAEMSKTVTPMYSEANFMLLALFFAIGLAVGMWINKKKN